MKTRRKAHQTVSVGSPNATSLLVRLQLNQQALQLCRQTISHDGDDDGGGDDGGGGQNDQRRQLLVQKLPIQRRKPVLKQLRQRMRRRRRMRLCVS